MSGPVKCELEEGSRLPKIPVLKDGEDVKQHGPPAADKGGPHFLITDEPQDTCARWLVSSLRADDARGNCSAAYPSAASSWAAMRLACRAGSAVRVIWATAIAPSCSRLISAAIRFGSATRAAWASSSKYASTRRLCITAAR